MAFYLMETCLVIYSLGTAYVQASLFNYWLKQGIPKDVDHPAWAAGYIAYMALMIYLFHTNVWMSILAAGLIREIFFAQALNLWRHKGFFYFNPEGKSLTDRLIKSRKRYIEVWAISLVLLISIQIINLKN
jgi:hypothetical protein